MKADDAIKAALPTGQERLLRRKLPQAVYHLRAVEPEEERAARQAVADAREHLQTVSFRVDDGAAAAIAEADEALEAARSVLAACYEPVVIQALEPEHFEEVAAQHPARPDEDEAYNLDTLCPELFYLGVQGALTREQWEEEVKPQLGRGEWMGLGATALNLNGRLSDGTIPKD